MFQDRASAGKVLAGELAKLKINNPVILAIPRGGVTVAAEVADMLGAPLDLVIPRKIGAPGNEELAIGAVVGPGQVVLNRQIVNGLGIPSTYIDEQVEKEVKEINRRRRLYLGEKQPIELGGRNVLIVDDGLATGYTALAAIKAIKQAAPAQLILAVPVAPPETATKVAKEVDELVCLDTPEPFFAVGQFYHEFGQVTDEEVMQRLKKVRAA